MSSPVSASIILAATAAAAVIMLAVFGEQALVTADIRSRMDIMREQTVERLDVTGRE